MFAMNDLAKVCECFDFGSSYCYWSSALHFISFHHVVVLIISVKESSH